MPDYPHAVEGDWFVPGGACIDDSRKVKLRLRPPEDWQRAILEIPRVPPSMNNNEIRSHWHGFHKHKKSWQDEIETLLMIEKVKRDNQRAIVGAFMRLTARRMGSGRIDPPNYAGLVNKACGDALVNYRAIPDDDAAHYFFAGVEFEEETGAARTRLFVYLQPKEG